MQTQIRLLKEEQSDQGLHNLSFHLYFEHNFLGLKILFYLNFRESTAKFSDIRQKMTENLGLCGRCQPHVLERNIWINTRLHVYIYILFDKVKIIVIICWYFSLYRGPQGRLVLPTVFYPRKIKTLLTYLLTFSFKQMFNVSALCK